MLTIKKVVCFYTLYNVVYGSYIGQPSKFEFTKAPQNLPAAPSGLECDPDKSLNSRNDIKIMIDHLYNEKSLDTIIKQNFQSEAEAIRDKHTQSVETFIEWFENQPEHLKDVIRRLQKLRKLQVEPVVEIVSNILRIYPELEDLYNEKNNKANTLSNKLSKYNMICKINCDEEHIITKRKVRDDLYCSSLEDLYHTISQSLDQFVQKLNNDKINELSANDTKFEEKIQQIKSELKRKALNEFGRTMYDIISLEDDYYHFMDEITSTDLNVIVYGIYSLGLNIDTHLLDLEQAVEKYGQYCSSCSHKTLVRNTRRAYFESEGYQQIEAQNNIITELLENKFKEIEDDIDTNWQYVFNDLNTLIERIDTEEISFQKLRPLQEEVSAMTYDEKEALNDLKNSAPSVSIKQILELIKKFQDLLKRIKDILDKLPK